MLATAAAGLARAPLALPDQVRNAAFVVLGLQVGASFTMESLASATQWPVSILVLLLTVAALVTGGYLLFSRVFNWDRPTAFFASKPGALAMAMAMAEHYGADLRHVAATQSLRLFLLIAAIPLIATGITGGDLPSLVPSDVAPIGEMLIILLAGAVAGYIAFRLGVPAGFLIGAMVVNAIAHLSGMVSGGVPAFLVIPAFVTLGAMVGVRFRDFSLSLLRQLLAAGLSGFVLSLTVAAIGAVVAAKLTGFPMLAMLLAFSPGGLEVMTILALTLGVNPAFVATHQLIRYLSLNLSMPFVSRLLFKSDRNTEN